MNFAGDLSVMDDQQTIGKTRYLFELRRNQQDGTTGIAQTDQLSMNELDRADIDTARRLRDQQQLRLNVILASDDQLLLIATGERPRRKCRVWWSNVECLDNLVGPALDR